LHNIKALRGFRLAKKPPAISSSATFHTDMEYQILMAAKMPCCLANFSRI